MAKALKPLVVILLILGIAALVMSIMLSSRRNALMDLAQKHESAMSSIAGNLRYDQLDLAQLRNPDTIQPQLDALAAAAANLYAEAADTKNDLQVMTEERDSARSEANQLKNRLADTENRLIQVTETIELKDSEIARAKGTIAQLEQDKSMYEIQVDDLKNQLVKADEDLGDAQSEVANLKKILDEIDSREGQAAGRQIPPGTSGRVLVVNPDWNFVVLDIGAEAGLVPNVDFVVHRGDSLVGKVRITSVDQNMAIAEIVNQWQQQPLNEGDNVLYVLF